MSRQGNTDKNFVRHENNRAFTLIELLVVIAIIGILAAMLLSVLSRAKNSASKVTDLNNLRQIMIALNVHTSDNGDVLPFPNWDGGFAGNGDFVPPPGWLYTVDPNAAGNDPARFVLQKGLLWNTLVNPKLYVCPSDDLQMQRWSDRDQVTEQRQQQLSSYAMNGAVIGYDLVVGRAPFKLAQMQPSDCAFWETDETEPYYFNDGANWPGEGVSGRHLQGGIQALFDGSVNYVKLKDWYDDVAYPGKNRLWCNPGKVDGGGPNGHNQQ